MFRSSFYLKKRSTAKPAFLTEINIKRFKALNCQTLENDILGLSKNHLKSIEFKPKLSVILPLGQNGKPAFDSEIYVRNKIKRLNHIGIEVNVQRKHFNKIEEISELIEELNEKRDNNGTFVQLPIIGQNLNKYSIKNVLDEIKLEKDIDCLSTKTLSRLDDINWKGMKPTTCIGICSLISFYDIPTKGKQIVILGKGGLVGKPLSKMLMSYPFYATVTLCDVFTENLKSITQQADILISACGQPCYVKPDFVKKDVILIDVGINRLYNEKTNQMKLVGDIDPSTYEKCKFYTKVPGGVGLLTTSSLTFNVVNACRLQMGSEPIELAHIVKGLSSVKQILTSDLPILSDENKNENLLPTKDEGHEKSVNALTNNKSSLSITLFSSAYNGMTQNIEQTLRSLGHRVKFCLANSDESMRSSIDSFKPDLIICPTLMKPIPKDIYQKYKCLIVHPGIRGDRGPSSLDWAILNQCDEWGVTILEADAEMDAGNIWATKNFKMPRKDASELTKTYLYNSCVLKTAESLVKECLNKFQNSNFKPEPLDYSNPNVKGRLHKTIKQTDKERIIDWHSDDSETILRKIKAADSRPGVKAEILIYSNHRPMTKFLYGANEEIYLKPSENIKPGQIFARRDDAVCIATKNNSAIWISQMRSPKSKENNSPIKLPSTIELKDFIDLIPESTLTSLISRPYPKTYQQICFDKINKNLGILYFDFYNGAMSTTHCNRLLSAIQICKSDPDLRVLVLAGSKRNWSNGINLNTIENSDDSSKEAWENIQAINNVVKEIIFTDKMLTISAIQTNAGAGGVYMALASDLVFADNGLVLNPHYVNMGLYGSELHTFTTLNRIGKMKLEFLKSSAKPLTVSQAIQFNLIDDINIELTKMKFVDCSLIENFKFLDKIKLISNCLVNDDEEFSKLILKKKELFISTLGSKSVEEYERLELNEMYEDIFNNRNGFHSKRFAFVKKLDPSNYSSDKKMNSKM